MKKYICACNKEFETNWETFMFQDYLDRKICCCPYIGKRYFFEIMGVLSLGGNIDFLLDDELPREEMFAILYKGIDCPIHKQTITFHKDVPIFQESKIKSENNECICPTSKDISISNDEVNLINDKTFESFNDKPLKNLIRKIIREELKKVKLQIENENDN